MWAVIVPRRFAPSKHKSSNYSPDWAQSAVSIGRWRPCVGLARPKSIDSGRGLLDETHLHGSFALFSAASEQTSSFARKKSNEIEARRANEKSQENLFEERKPRMYLGWAQHDVLRESSQKANPLTSPARVSSPQKSFRARNAFMRASKTRR